MSGKNTQTVLAVDLDNTLIKTDMIVVGLKFLLLHKLYYLPKLAWLFIFKGKTHAKQFLYLTTHFSISSINFNQSVINFIKTNKKIFIYYINIWIIL